ncbi:Erythromycin esterase type I [[Actinomadura] parvosata subsp. kistnae]|uniref:Erythromycin esterase n=1 Tax=[Actinomadura] parvosata subsp. kistnae TaxID=1909395 RepID=A0A1U9ZRD2_9ACTN|nr:erythromycin esterase family protein [Nonomuraea sp. ATCC 55076]AQZ60502.1 erythromycin esterase [Nonomuraea sp. ATCC 55076]SPL90943.1 Erythromycin esterase type I [Actinomadura parvosata subsp. kistnae]
MNTHPATPPPSRLSEAAVIPLRTLDPAAPLDDLTWLDDAIGDARVVALGESAHYNREFYDLRHRLLRYLAERHGFSAYAMETGFTEAWRANTWVTTDASATGALGVGGGDRLGEVMASGLSSLMGVWRQLGAHLEWMRRHNATAARPVGFYGIDLGGHNASLLPALDAVLAYLAQADPEHRVDPAVRETAAAFAATSAFAAPAALAAYAQLPPETRNALTAGLAALSARMRGRRLEYARRTGAEEYERALRCLSLAVTLDSGIRDMVSGDLQSVMYERDAEMADTVEWILRRHDRIVVAAHNGHVQRWPGVLPGMDPVTPLGMHLADRLGAGYLVIGATTGTGQMLNSDPAAFQSGALFAPMGPPDPGSLDALLHASHDGPFVTDLRRLSPADAEAVRAAAVQRAGNGPHHSPISALDAYDLVLHLPHVTAADPDEAALAASPEEVREIFSHYKPL